MNTFYKKLDAAGQRAAYDASCKCLLANKMILACILKECIQEYENYTIKEIANRYIEDDPVISKTAVHPDEVSHGAEQIRGLSTEDSSINEGTVTYDIRFLAIVPVSEERISLIVNIEAQNNFYPGYPIIKRGIYYCSRMISSQYGTEFSGSHYGEIKKVYSIWICPNPPKSRRNSITTYSMEENHLWGAAEAEKRENYDLMTAVLVCLGSEEDQYYEGIVRMLEVLLSSERKPDEKKRILEHDFNIEMTGQLEREVSDMCNLSEGVEQKGIEKGIEKGRQEGIEKGRRVTIIHSVKEIQQKLGMSPEEALELLAIPKEEWSRYIDIPKEN